MRSLLRDLAGWEMAMAYERKDPYWRRAKQEGYRSRAAYKLIEIQKRFRVFHRGQRVVDLGCAPGGWLQVISSEIGLTGKVVGVDRLRIEPLPVAQVVFIQGDVVDPSVHGRIRAVMDRLVDVVTSDMAPDLSGVSFQDHHRSCELARQAFSISGELLAPGGVLLVKVFEGEELAALQRELVGLFKQVRRVIPRASRKASSEVYLLARGRRPVVEGGPRK